MNSLSLTGARWGLPEVAPEVVQAIQQASGLSEPAAQCVALRWGPEGAHPWSPLSVSDLYSPWEMHNMAEAIERLQRALANRESIRLITDYDVDGTTSSLILQAALRIAGGKGLIDYHIPDRFDEGYGFSVRAAEQAAADGVKLIVTADIGVRDHAAVDAARAAGVDVLICDHHLPAGASVPEGATVLCPPQVACDYPNSGLAACGVSLKVAQALLADHPKYEAVLTSLLKLAAIGTVADLVPLTSRENRAIVSMGLGALNEGRHHPGLAELLKVSQLTPGSIRESDLGFRVGPRINAAGRVSSAELVVELLNCRDPFRARDLAKHIDGLNTERRDIERRLTDVALGAVSDPPDPFVLVAGPEEDGWHRGVVGIVAARIKERVNRPTAVVSIQGDRAVGSVRSVAGVHAVRALESVEDLLVKFGGHPAAAGFTVPVEHLDAMRSRLGAWVAENHSDDDLIPKRGVDVVVAARDLDDTLFFDFARLAPFGMGNPVPRLLVQNVRPWNARVIGKARTTLKFLIPRGDGSHVEAIWWGRPEMLDALSSHAVDLLGNLEENVWKGRRSLQFRVKDIRITS